MKKKTVAIVLLTAMILTAMPVNMMQVYAANTNVSALIQEATTTFTFTDSTVNAIGGSEDSYKIEDTNLTIKESGIYIISGTCSEGSVTVKKGTTNVTLILQNLTLSCSNGAPITINKENTDTTIVITGTNTLTDNEDPADEESTDAEVADAFEGAAIKLKSGGSLTITGTGTLNINGNAKNGIKGGDGATINIGASASDSFTLNVTAANDGISGDGSEDVAGLNIIGGTINVSAGDDGIKSDYVLNIGQEGSTAGATINVTSSVEGLEGATVNLYGGTGKIVSSDDGINAANSDLTGYSYALNIYGGTWNIDAGGDGIDSNGTILVAGGVTDVSSSTQNDNNAIDWGEQSNITVTGGTIIGVGMGGMQQGFTNGNYVMFGQSGGMGGQMPGGMGGQMPGNTSGDTTGGSFTPGEMPSDFTPGQMPGGQNSQSGQRPEMPGNGNTGNNGNFTPGQMPGGNESTSSVSLSKGDTITITDESGTVLYTTTAKKAANSVIFSSEDLVSGSTYTLNVNGSAVATATVGESGNSGTQPGGQQPGENEGQQPPQEEQQEKPEQQKTAGSSVYRFYNTNTGEHFYSTSEAEKQNLIKAGWSYEGVAYNAADEKTGTALYRVCNPYTGDHHYTTNKSEATYLISIGWRDEGTAFYVKASGNTPVYRLYNPNATVAGAHHYTADYNEYQSLIKAGWNDEGICWYI